jgi:hypothetical protein
VEPGPCAGPNPALPDDSSESNNYSLVPYGELDALRFKVELEEAQRELEESPRKLELPNSTGRTNANSCWQPSTVYPLD